MKIGKLGLATALTGALFMTQCKPKTANIEPVADTETESSVQASWANYMVADIEQLCAFMGEDKYDNHFYYPAVFNNNYEAVAELNAVQKYVTWRNGPVMCRDGRTREGSVFMYTYVDLEANPDADINSRYYRDYGFVGNISFGNYYVDGWEVKLQDDGNRMYLYNKRKTRIYTADQILTFRIKGKVIFKHPTDENKDITWEGELYKQVVNSTDKEIFDPSAQKAINWFVLDKNGKLIKAALCKYYGSSFGYTEGKKPYKMEIKPETPLVRDYMCTSDPVASVSAASTGTVPFTFTTDQHHPFISGIASFTTGTTAENKYPRQIYFGNEATPDQAVQCDNTGVVNIKGNYYPINFRK